MKIKFNSDDDLPLSKTLELDINMVIAVRPAFMTATNIIRKIF